MGEQVDREAPFEHPAQHVGIEQVPLAVGLDDRALARAGADQALGGQHLDRLARDRAADPVRFGQFGLGRKTLFVVGAAHDQQPEPVEQAICQVAPQGIARFEGLGGHGRSFARVKCFNNINRHRRGVASRNMLRFGPWHGQMLSAASRGPVFFKVVI
jgi:hypothetical protein